MKDISYCCHLVGGAQCGVVNESQVLSIFMSWGWSDRFELEEGGFIDV